jgi:hypothetical protein
MSPAGDYAQSIFGVMELPGACVIASALRASQ